MTPVCGGAKTKKSDGGLPSVVRFLLTFLPSYPADPRRHTEKRPSSKRKDGRFRRWGPPLPPTTAAEHPKGVHATLLPVLSNHFLYNQLFHSRTPMRQHFIKKFLYRTRFFTLSNILNSTSRPIFITWPNLGMPRTFLLHLFHLKTPFPSKKTNKQVETKHSLHTFISFSFRFSHCNPFHTAKSLFHLCCGLQLRSTFYIPPFTTYKNSIPFI
jgi:hypothetical protein